MTWMLTTELGILVQSSNEAKMGELHSMSWISLGCSKFVYIIDWSGSLACTNVNINDNYLNYLVGYPMVVIQN